MAQDFQGCNGMHWFARVARHSSATNGGKVDDGCLPFFSWNHGLRKIPRIPGLERFHWVTMASLSCNGLHLVPRDSKHCKGLQGCQKPLVLQGLPRRCLVSQQGKDFLGLQRNPQKTQMLHSPPLLSSYVLCDGAQCPWRLVSGAISSMGTIRSNRSVKSWGRKFY